MTLINKIKKLQTKLAKMEKEEALRKSRLKFLCCCKKMHRICDCELLQPMSYCINGEDWLYDCLEIVCPYTQDRNRLYFTSDNIEKRFVWKYKYLFKSNREYNKNNRNEVRGNWNNNYYFNNHIKKFGLDDEQV